MIMLQRDNYVTTQRTDDLLDELEQLSRMQHAFIQKLRNQ
jgi:hypothetical protein